MKGEQVGQGGGSGDFGEGGLGCGQGQTDQLQSRTRVGNDWIARCLQSPQQSDQGELSTLTPQDISGSRHTGAMDLLSGLNTLKYSDLQVTKHLS